MTLAMNYIWNTTDVYGPVAVGIPWRMHGPNFSRRIGIIFLKGINLHSLQRCLINFLVEILLG